MCRYKSHVNQTKLFGKASPHSATEYSAHENRTFIKFNSCALRKLRVMRLQKLFQPRQQPRRNLKRGGIALTRVEVGSNYPDSPRVDPGVALRPASAKTSFKRSHNSDDLIKRNIRWIEIQTGTATDYPRLPTPPSRIMALSFNPKMPIKSAFARDVILVQSQRTAEPSVKGDLT
jgi:hypothetical protein